MDCIDIGIFKSQFLAKNQLLFQKIGGGLNPNSTPPYTPLFIILKQQKDILAHKKKVNTY